MTLQTVICCVNGEDEVRLVDYIEDGGPWPFPSSSRDLHLSRPMPKLHDGERVEWVLGDIRPHIVRA